jgi:hypothetical protein
VTNLSSCHWKAAVLKLLNNIDIGERNKRQPHVERLDGSPNRAESDCVEFKRLARPSRGFLASSWGERDKSLFCYPWRRCMVGSQRI